MMFVETEKKCFKVAVQPKFLIHSVLNHKKFARFSVAAAIIYYKNL